MRYRRTFIPGGTFFFTVVTFEQRQLFIDKRVLEILRQAFRTIRIRRPFQIEAAVILPDHLHMIWSLPENESDYPTGPVRLRSGMFHWRLIKSYFTRRWGGAVDIPTSDSRQQKRERADWQRRYWEHVIRDEKDLKRHVEYIHYNPVKHGLVKAPVEWKYSSFYRFVKQGLYTADWGAEAGVEMKLDARMK